MPYNGTGIFTRVYQWTNDAVNGLFVDATRTDTDSNDIAAGLTNCITRDGQSPAAANLPMGGFKLTGMGNGGVATDSVNYGQVFNSPAFVTPTATTTPATGNNSQLLATTQFVARDFAPLVSPALTGTPTVPTAAPGTNTTQAASTAYVVAQAFSSALPAQAGNSGKFITTNGATASWGVPNFQAGATAAEIRTGTDTTKVVTAGNLLTALGVTNYAQTADQTITAGGLLTIAHGLGRTPVLTQAYLKNATAENGFSVGDIIPASPMSPGGTAPAVVITSDATNIYICFGISTNAFISSNKTVGNSSAATNANWRFFLRVWA